MMMTAAVPSGQTGRGRDKEQESKQMRPVTKTALKHSRGNGRKWTELHMEVDCPHVLTGNTVPEGARGYAMLEGTVAEDTMKKGKNAVVKGLALPDH